MQADSVLVAPDSIPSDNEGFLSDLLSACRDCFSLNRITSGDLLCATLFITVILAFLIFVWWFSKKYKKERPIIIAIAVGIAVNFLTLLIQNNIRYFSKDTIKQLQQQDSILKDTRSISTDTRKILTVLSNKDLDIGEKKKKKFEDFSIESHTETDFRMNIKDDKLEIDTNITVEIDILEERYRWKCQSTTAIIKKRDGREIEKNITDIIENYSETQYKDAKGFICMGSASSEGKPVEKEEERAKKRMLTLCNSFKSSLPLTKKDYPIYGLNLGKFIEHGDPIGCAEKRRDQRRVVILKIIYQRENLTLSELSDAVIRLLLQKIKKAPDFPIDIRKYSKYEGEELVLQKC